MNIATHKPLKCASDLFESIDLERAKPRSRVWSRVMDEAPSRCVQMQHSKMTGWSMTGPGPIQGWPSLGTVFGWYVILVDYAIDKSVASKCPSVWNWVLMLYIFAGSCFLRSWSSLTGSRLKRFTNFLAISQVQLKSWPTVFLENCIKHDSTLFQTWNAFVMV